MATLSYIIAAKLAATAMLLRKVEEIRLHAILRVIV
jgi:hypothetical protein